MTGDLSLIFSAARMQAAGTGPLYVKLRRMLEEAVREGALKQGDALPPERDIAEFAEVSRVTVRKAIDHLVADGLLMRRHGSGTFVSRPVSKVEQKLSQLTSFTEDMARRGMKARSQWLHKGVHTPSPDEMMILGLAAGAKVSRLSRLRVADDQPLAIEHASVSDEFLPDPSTVSTSLYAELEKRQVRPVRAVQRISATNMREADAELLGVSVGAAGLSIERISYLASGRAVEFTRSLYRGDAYDFVAELTIGES
jgi:GntR family transcriptional regulator